MRAAVMMQTIRLVLVILFAVGLSCSDDKTDSNPGVISVSDSGGMNNSGTGGTSVTDVDSGIPISALDSGTDGESLMVNPKPDAGTPPSSGTGGAPMAGNTGMADSATPPISVDGGPTSTDAAEEGLVDSGKTEIALPGTVPVDPPVPDECITDVSAGEHTFVCGDISYLVVVGEMCTQFACGLILDVHGAMMDGRAQRDSTQLHVLAPSKGFIVIHPSAPGSSWNWQGHMPQLVDFMTRMIHAFHVDERRIHVTGFSMGSGVTFWFLCNHTEALASTAPISGQSADQVVDIDTNSNCIQSIDANWQPRVPILFLNGRRDNGLTEQLAIERTEGIVSRLGLTGGEEIDSGPGWVRTHYEGEDEMVFDFILHDWAGLVAGHCIPGGNSFVSCWDTDPSFNWGEVVLQWFLDHPKR